MDNDFDTFIASFANKPTARMEAHLAAAFEWVSQLTTVAKSTQAATRTLVAVVGESLAHIEPAFDRDALVDEALGRLSSLDLDNESESN